VSDWCEIPEFFSESQQVARKEHVCCECDGVIHIGEWYLNCRGKWDGEIGVYKQHMLCAFACIAIRDYQDGECIPFGYLREWLSAVDVLRLPKANRLLRAYIAIAKLQIRKVDRLRRSEQRGSR
jgi:hypothetical protein